MGGLPLAASIAARAVALESAVIERFIASRKNEIQRWSMTRTMVCFFFSHANVQVALWSWADCFQQCPASHANKRGLNKHSEKQDSVRDIRSWRQTQAWPRRQTAARRVVWLHQQACKLVSRLLILTTYVWVRRARLHSTRRRWAW